MSSWTDLLGDPLIQNGSIGCRWDDQSRRQWLLRVAQHGRIFYFALEVLRSDGPRPKVSLLRSDWEGGLYHMHVATKSFSVNRWKPFAIVSFPSSFTPSFFPESSLTHIHYCSQARINDVAGRLCVSCAPCFCTPTTPMSSIVYSAHGNIVKVIYLLRQEQWSPSPKSCWVVIPP